MTKPLLWVWLTFSALLYGCASEAIDNGQARVNEFELYEQNIESPEAMQDYMRRLLATVDACMAKQGFDMPTVDVPDIEWFERNFEFVRLGDFEYFLAMDIEDAEGIGLGVAAGLELRESDFEFEPFAVPIEGDGQVSYGLALFGQEGSESGEGCLHESEHLVGSWGYPEESGEALERFSASPEFVEFADRWVECMNGNSYNVAYPHPAAIKELIAHTEEELTGKGLLLSDPEVVQEIERVEKAILRSHVQCAEVGGAEALYASWLEVRDGTHHE